MSCNRHVDGAVAALALLCTPVAAQVTDGDTLKQGGVTYRLWGVDAPEAKQVCPDGWPAGSLATTRLQALTAGRSIVCQEKDRDRYGRIVAICRASGENLGAIMVREGLAWAFVRYSADYVGQEGKAKADRLGVHVHGCVPAWEWRVQQRR
jgi:endonuclease YncB( thermonuclease family)